MEAFPTGAIGRPAIQSRIDERRDVPVTNAEPKIQIEIKNADLLTSEDDAILVPTHSDGRMVGEIAARAKQRGGEEVEREAMECAPIAVGAAVMTTAGELRAAHVIHVPLVEQPGVRLGVENIRRATRAGLLAASHYGLDRVALPGMGYEDGSVPFDEVARAIIDEVRAYKCTPPSTVVLMDTNAEMLEAFTNELGEV